MRSPPRAATHTLFGRAAAMQSEEQPVLSPAPPPSVNTIPESTQEGAAAGAAWCNSVTVVMDLVNASSAVCKATGVRIELGKGLQVSHAGLNLQRRSFFACPQSQSAVFCMGCHAPTF